MKMENIINQILDLIRNIKTSRPNKLIFTCLAFAMILTIDFLFSISYDIHINSKISTLENLKKIEDSYKNDPTLKREIAIMKHDIANKKHFYDRLFTRTRSNDFLQPYQTNEYSKFNALVKSFLFTFPILLILSLSIILQIHKRTLYVSLKWGTVILIIILINYLFYELLNTIPLILNNILYNETLRLVTSFLLAYIILKLIIKEINEDKLFKQTLEF